VLKSFRNWLEDHPPDVLRRSPLGNALGYALNHWEALSAVHELGHADDRQQRCGATYEDRCRGTDELVVHEHRVRRLDHGGPV
jgi:hypothetical protein